MFDYWETKNTDYGPFPYVVNVQKVAVRNPNFRTALWTGCHLQMTLMCIPPCNDIGPEVHDDTDQFIRVEQGNASVQFGRCKCQMDCSQNLCQGDAVFVPAGTWHNIRNTGRIPLKLSSIYTPPHHPSGTIHKTKGDAQKEY